MPHEQDDIDDRELTTRPLKAPDFKPSIPESDLDDFNQRDKKLLLAFYKTAQQVDWLVENIIEMNRQQREIEREQIRSKRWRKSTTMKLTLASSIAVFVISTMTSGLLVKLADAVLAAIIHR